MYYLKMLLALSGLLMINEACTQDLSNHRWQHRLVIVLTDQPTNAAYVQQLQELQRDEAALTERRILVYQSIPQQYRIGLGDEDWAQSSSIYEQYKRSDTPFEVLLIGLDGGVKLRRTEPVAQADLFSLIDQMPMRQAEMRRKKKS